MRPVNVWFLSIGLLAAAPADAAGNCGGRPCPTSGTVKGSSIIPGPDDFTLRGDVFSDTYTDLAVAGGPVAVDLGFTVNLGFGPTATAYVYRSGFVSFGSPLSGDFQPVRNLSDLDAPVIAPYYASLTPGAGSGDGKPEVGDVIVQYGQNDPYPDGGAYMRADLRDAVRITWYGLSAGTAATGAPEPVYTQLLISTDVNGLSSFEFRYGPPNAPGQADYGSLAGFALGNTQVQFTGPYTSGRNLPTFFEFQDGQYIGQYGTRIGGGVPEPATWAAMVLGFGLAGGALRRRRRVRSLSA